MKIIGLSGKMQSGKTTVAEYLRANINYQQGDYPMHIEGFSSNIKELVARHFAWDSIDESELDDQAIKDSKHESGKTYRQILQDVGRELRNIWPDVWIKSWKRGVGLLPDHWLIVVPDVRYPNEVKAIQELGGIVIRLTRNPVNSDDETECALDFAEPEWLIRDNIEIADSNAYFKAIINNRIMSIDETNQAVLRIAKEYLGHP